MILILKSLSLKRLFLTLYVFITILFKIITKIIFSLNVLRLLISITVRLLILIRS